MDVYREERSIDCPPETVASAVFDDPDARRRSTRRFTLYRTETGLDTSDGSLRTTVAVPGVTIATMAAVAIAAVGVVSPALRLIALWACALAVVVPLGHLLPAVDGCPDVGRVTDRRVTPVTAPAFAAAVGTLWLTLSSSLGPAATWFCGALLVVGAACYAVGAGWRTATVSTLWLPAAGLLPVLSTLGALAVVVALAGQTSPTVAIAAGVAFTLGSVGVVTTYSYLVCRSVSTARFEPLGSSGRRSGLLAGYLAVVFVLLGVGAHLATGVADRFGPGVVAVLAAPLVLPAGGWLLHVVRTGLARLAAVQRADRTNVDGVPLYVLDVDEPFVRAVSLPRGVFVSRPVVETLDDTELAAVVAHERHHLEGRSRIGRFVLGAASVLVGRNPIAAFLDYPARERSADRYAVERTGTEPLVRALRRLEGLDRGTAGSPRLVAAPHALLYGTVADAAIYPSVDERIAAVADQS